MKNLVTAKYRCYFRYFHFKTFDFTIYHWEYFHIFPFCWFPKVTFKEPYRFKFEWLFFNAYSIKI
jgi:hypothetical protein